MFEKSFRSVAAPIFLFAMTAGFTLALTATAASAGSPSGTCVIARIDAPFRLPDGILHPAATLTLCSAESFSPVATIHRTYVNGRPAGMFVSRNRRGEGNADVTPGVLFQIDGAGHLDLLGYVTPSGGRSVAYQMGERRSASAPALAGAAAPIAIVLAAK